MSSYSEFASNLSQIIESGANAQAEAQRQRGQIWNTALSNIGQIVANIPKERAQQQELQLRAQAQGLEAQKQKMALDAMQRAKQGEDQANQFIASLPKNPDGTFPVDQISQGLAQRQVPLDMQERFVKSISGANDFIVKTNTQKTEHLAELANFLLTQHEPNEPVTADTLHLGVALAKHLNLATDADEQQLTTLVGQGVDPEQILKAVRSQGSKFNAAPKSAVQLAPGGKLVEPETGKTIAENPYQLTPNEQMTQERLAREAVERKANTEADNARADAQLAIARAREKREEATTGAAGPGSAGQLTPEGVDLAATQFRVTGTMPAMGMGRTPERFAVINRAAEQAKTLGQTPAVAIQKQFAMKADAGALKQLQTLSSSAEAAENKAVGQIGIISDLSAKVPRTQFPLVNAALQSGRLNLGDPNAQQFANAIQTFANEYGKIIEGSTGSVSGSSDTARAASMKLVNAAMNPKTLDGVLKLMQREMDLTLAGYDAAISHVTTKMGGVPGASMPTAAPTTTQTPTLRFNPATGKVEPIGAR